jgi:hypothetical protein
MSKSDHSKSRKFPGQRGTVNRRARSFRRRANFMATHWDDSKVVPNTKALTSSGCGYGCCW